VGVRVTRSASYSTTIGVVRTEECDPMTIMAVVPSTKQLVEPHSVQRGYPKSGRLLMRILGRERAWRLSANLPPSLASKHLCTRRYGVQSPVSAWSSACSLTKEGSPSESDVKRRLFQLQDREDPHGFFAGLRECFVDHSQSNAIGTFLPISERFCTTCSRYTIMN